MSFQPNFVTFTNTDIIGRKPMLGFKGNQNNGFTFIQFADGSGGIEKQLKDWTGNKTGRLYPAEILAAQEWLASRVGEVMNAPIRDCLFTSDAKTIVMPYINGESGLEQGIEDCYPDNAQGANLHLFDYLTANSDRRPKNIIIAKHGIVGIDHALCNFRPRTPSPELIAELWNAGLTPESLDSLRPKLSNLRSLFVSVGMVEKHNNLLDNLDLLRNALAVISQYAVVEKGDVTGHPFHGNQWTGGVGEGSEELTRKVIAAVTNNGEISDKNGKAEQDRRYGVQAKVKAQVASDIAKRLGDRFDKKLLNVRVGGTQRLINGEWTAVKPVTFGTHRGADDAYQMPTEESPLAYMGKMTPDEMKANGCVAGNDTSVADLVRAQSVSGLISQWAESSNNGESRSLALQQAAIDEFGLTDATTNQQWLGDSPYARQGQASDIQDKADKFYAQNGELYRAFLRAQYDSTQEFFAKAGITEIPAYRGMIWGSGDTVPDWAKQDGQTNITMRPLASFSYQERVAYAFATDSFREPEANAVVSATIPVASILSCARTGMGCLGEKEIVVLGGNLPFTVKASIPLERNGGTLPPLVKSVINKGDTVGHEFHGNQWEKVISTKVDKEALGENLRVRSSIEPNGDIHAAPWQEHDEIAAQYKSSVCADLARRMNKPVPTVSRLLAQWAFNSSKTPEAIALQQVVREEFGLTSARAVEPDESQKGAVERLLKDNGDLYRSFVHAQYDATQEMFKNAGITHLVAYRGMLFDGVALRNDGVVDSKINPSPPWVSEAAQSEGGLKATEITTNPVSSFTYEPFVAEDFSNGKNQQQDPRVDGYIEYSSNVVVYGVVPVERILSCAKTGMGCLGEQEITVLGGKDTWNVQAYIASNNSPDSQGAPFDGSTFTL